MLSILEIKIPPSFTYYQISISALQNRLGKKITPDQMLEAAKNLVTRTYNFHSTEGEVQSSMLSSVYEFSNKGYIEVGIEKIMQLYLIGLKENYTEFELSIALCSKKQVL